MKSKVNNLIFIVIIGILLGLSMSVSYCASCNPYSDDIDIKIDDKTKLVISAPSENGIPICDKVRDQSRPKITTDEANGSIIAWYDKRNDAGNDIFAQRIDPDGNAKWFESGLAVDMSNTGDFKILSDGDGGFVFTWDDFYYKSFQEYDHEIYGMHISSNGGRLWPGTSVEICDAVVDAPYDTHRTVMCSDGSGGIIATWEDWRDPTYSDIYAQRVNSTGGVQWTTNGEEICNATYNQKDPTICIDGEGGAIIAWEDHQWGDINTDIFIQRINSTGSINWTFNGEPACAQINGQTNPKICSDDNNGAIVAWIDDRVSGSDSIYAQRINKTGQSQWTTLGIQVASTMDNINNMKICKDEFGGAIISWQDARTVGDIIYVQRIDSSGTVLWTVDGVAICTVNTTQADHQLCSDGAGGAIITWEDERSDYGDIYAQRVDSNGDIKWTTNGIPIATALYDQRNPGIVADGQGGAIITWEDWRSGTIDEWGYPSYESDIYAQRVNSNGVFQWIGENEAPISNHPKDITISRSASETINWTIYDDSENGLYRVLMNDSAEHSIVWRDWWDWSNEILIQVPINSTTVGIYDYTIEYYDNEFVSGVSDTVRVEIETSTGGGGLGFRIPFGNYYLLFGFLSIIAIVIVTKYRISSKSK